MFKRNVKRITVIFFVILITFVAGCQTNRSEPTINNEAKEYAINRSTNLPVEQTPITSPNAVEKSKYTAPLTGLPTEEELTRRIIAVMIENHPDARPQSGLNEADIVYEILAEGDITRFIAFFQSKEPAIIGPVRSVRPYYIETAKGFDAVIVHAGGSEQALNMLRNEGYPHLDEIYNAGEAFWRDSTRKMPHNLYTSFTKVYNVLKERGYRLESNLPKFYFREEEKIDSKEEVKEVTIPYYQSYKVTYIYDPEKGEYLRFINEKPHTDRETKEQIRVKNILIIKTKHQVLDSYGRRAVNVYGPGEGYLLQNGKITSILWKREGGIIKGYKNGIELGLIPGNTWVQVIPLENNIITQ